MRVFSQKKLRRSIALHLNPYKFAGAAAAATYRQFREPFFCNSRSECQGPRVSFLWLTSLVPCLLGSTAHWICLLRRVINELLADFRNYSINIFVCYRSSIFG